jgi:phenylacetate-CoA ligase
VRETYGMAENVASATECEAGGLHQWPEVGVTEVDGHCPVAPGTTGDSCTGSLNPGMPLIRTGWAMRPGPPEDTACACGRTLPLMTSIDGRIDDILWSRDGRVYRLEPVLYGVPLHEAQIVQEHVDRVARGARDGVARVGADRGGPDPRADGGRGHRLRARAADPRTKAGKFRLVQCELPAAQLEALLSLRQAS